MGKSRPWPEALKKLTGSSTLDVDALFDYFKPLRAWMEEQRKTIGYPGPGWDDDDQPPTAGMPSLVPTLFGVFAVLFTLVAFFW